jgi:hypothetical protein
MKGPESASIETHELSAPVRGLAVGSFGMGFFAFLVWWWVPFGFLLAIASTIMATLSIILGVRTKERGLYFALGAMAMAICTTSAALIATKFANLAFLEL